MKGILSKNTVVGSLGVHYFTGGAGDNLVVIHGGGEGASAWEQNIAELTKHYTVYAPDLPGFGDSQQMEGGYSMPVLIEFMEGFTRSLGLDSFYLMGHSVGGAIAVNYTLDHPEKVKKLVLVSSMSLGKEVAWWIKLLSFPALWRNYARSLITVLKGVKWTADLFLSPAEFQIPLSIASIYMGGTVANIIKHSAQAVERLSDVVAPTLLIWGAKDPILPAKVAYAAAARIPDCQVRVFEDCGHSVYRDKIPEFSRTLTRFLG